MSLTQSLSKVNETNRKQLNRSLGISQNINPQEELIKTFGQSSYLDSFEELMEIDNIQRQSYRKVNPISQKLRLYKNQNRIDRISLPNIIEYQNSQFTALDPINIPINQIKQQIQKTRKQISTCPNQLKRIKCDMQQYKQRHLEQHDQFKVQYIEQLKRLRLKLSQNTVYQQSFVLSTKRQLKVLEQFIPAFQEQFFKTHQSQIKLQEVIFQKLPFELQMLKDHGEEQGLQKIEKQSSGISYHSNLVYF